MLLAQPNAVAQIFATYPPEIRRHLLVLRNLILNVAAATEGVGKLDETLKWGEPAFVTKASKSGSTIRIAWKPAAPNNYYMYFICTTNLVDSFRTLFPNDFEFEGNRALVFTAGKSVPQDSLSVCIAAALRYQLDRKWQAVKAKAL